MNKASETRQCPYCKEEIKSDAIKCKHCGSRIAPERPGHEGVCPFCKEQIHPDAIKCKHCKSVLNSESGCNCHHGAQTDYGGDPVPSGGFQSRESGPEIIDLGGAEGESGAPGVIYMKCIDHCRRKRKCIFIPFRGQVCWYVTECQLTCWSDDYYWESQWKERPPMPSPG
jgi:hypothetical protein